MTRVIDRLVARRLVRALVDALVGTCQAVDGGQVDDHAAPLRQHGLDCRLAAQECAGQVDIQGLVPGFQGIIFEGAGSAVLARLMLRVELGIQGGAVDQDVQPAERLPGPPATMPLDGIRAR